MSRTLQTGALVPLLQKHAGFRPARAVALARRLLRDGVFVAPAITDAEIDLVLALDPTEDAPTIRSNFRAWLYHLAQ